jgi:hypothetical protein
MQILPHWELIDIIQIIELTSKLLVYVPVTCNLDFYALERKIL